MAELPRRELLCGFVSGWAELERWDAADLFQFYHDTTPYLGTLDALLPRIDRAARPAGGAPGGLQYLSRLLSQLPA